MKSKKLKALVCLGLTLTMLAGCGAKPVKQLEAELGFCFFPQIMEQMEILYDFVTRPYLIVGSHHWLAGRAVVSLKELRGENLIADMTPDGKKLFMEGRLQVYGLIPRIILPMMSDATKRAMVQQGNYVAFSSCPKAWLPYGVAAVELMEEQEWVSSSFAKWKGRPLSEAAQMYCDYIIPRFEAEIGPSGVQRT